nr:hypothetical protein [Tanacetum cinerariifolium]
MANLFHYGLDDLAEVHNHDNVNHNVINQAVQAMPYSEQSNIMNHSEFEITSDSNIISYSQPIKVEVPKELPKVSMVNTSLKKLKHHLVSFDVVVKERTTTTAITEGTLGFELNLKSVENSDLNASLQEKVLVIIALKDNLRKLKGKAIVDDVVPSHPIDPELMKVDIAPLAPKLQNNRTVHSNYLRHTPEETATLREIVKENQENDKIESKPDKNGKRESDEINTAKVTLMANLFHYGLDDLAEAAVQNSSSPAQQDVLILSVIEQLKTQVVNCTKINLDNKSVNNTLTVELERYKKHVRILTEGQNVDLKSKENVLDSCAQSKARQLEPKLYDGNFIEKTNAIVIRDSKETLMLAEESRSKMLLKQKDPKMSKKKINTTPVDYANSVNFPEPTPLSRPIKVEVPKELPKVSMEKVLVIIALKDNLRKLKGKAIVDDVVPSHPIDPELMKVDIAPLAPKLQNNRIVHSNYLRHTPEETATLREIVKQGRSLNPLNTS